MKTLLLLFRAVFGTVLGYYDANSPECLSREEYDALVTSKLPIWEPC